MYINIYVYIYMYILHGNESTRLKENSPKRKLV